VEMGLTTSNMKAKCPETLQKLEIRGHTEENIYFSLIRRA